MEGLVKSPWFTLSKEPPAQGYLGDLSQIILIIFTCNRSQGHVLDKTHNQVEALA